MVLRVTYPDKYALWGSLLAGASDRLFVATTDRPPLGGPTPLELRVEADNVRLVVEGSVVGLRPASRRFDEGVYVTVPPGEIQKCRRFLGLQETGWSAPRARRAGRVHHRLDVRFEEPELPFTYSTMNVSETGMFVCGEPPLPLLARQRVRVRLPAEAEAVSAEVAWIAPDGRAAGLQLVDLEDTGRARLQAIVRDAISAYRGAPRNQRPILLADDDPAILGLMMRALSRHGYEVFQALRGDEALGLIRELQPALVLMDLLMPRVDGAEICRAMRADAELASIPVVFVSAVKPDRLHAVAEGCGASDYLTKPVDLHDLLDLAAYYLGTPAASRANRAAI